MQCTSLSRRIYLLITLLYLPPEILQFIVSKYRAISKRIQNTLFTKLLKIRKKKKNKKFVEMCGIKMWISTLSQHCKVPLQDTSVMPFYYKPIIC